MPTVVNEAFLPVNVLERKIHDVEYFKSQSRISVGEIRKYAAENNLPLDESRIERLKSLVSNDFQPHLDKMVAAYQVAANKTGDRAQSILEFAGRHDLFLSTDLTQELTATINTARHEQATFELRRMIGRVQEFMNDPPQPPFSEKDIRDHALKHNLPLNEELLKTLFK